MLLSDKISLLSRNDTVSELDAMLNNAHVSINWHGKRLVSVDGYAGSVEIDKLANKYLRANAFRGESNPSLQKRLECHALWGRVQKLYADSDEELKRTWLFKYYVPLKEFKLYCRSCAGDPMAILGEWELGAKKDSLFEFDPKMFKQMWPNEEPQGKSWTTQCGETIERWRATKEMIEAALANQSKSE